MTINALRSAQDQPGLQNQHFSVEIPHRTQSICTSQTPRCVSSEEPEHKFWCQTLELCWKTKTGDGSNRIMDNVGGLSSPAGLDTDFHVDQRFLVSHVQYFSIHSWKTTDIPTRRASNKSSPDDSGGQMCQSRLLLCCLSINREVRT